VFFLKKNKEPNEEEATTKRMQVMFDAMPFCANFWNSSFDHLDCNQAAVKMFELRDKREYSDKFFQLSPEYQPCGNPSRGKAISLVKRAFEEGYCRFEWKHQKLNGDPIPCEVTLVRTKFGNDDIVVGYTRDMREENNLNEYKAMIAEMQKVKDDLRLARDVAEAASFTQTAFLANMSHEIRTAMSSIMGFSELAMDTSDHSETRDYLHKIQMNTEWLLQIINDILDISKIESGKMELENIPFDVCELFTDCRTLILPKAVEKDIMLYFYADPSVGSMLLGDPTRLRQVLMNLLSNAVRFTNTGIVKFLAKIKKRNENSVNIHFTVRDSGVGMTKAQVSKIFAPFTQGDPSAIRKYGGTGLGLAITKNIIELMGGTLVVESTPGVGSKFSFELAFDTVEPSGDEMVTEKIMFDEFEKPVFEGEVLLCEDNSMNQQVICENLARVGLKTSVAENGRIGLEMVQRRMKAQDEPGAQKQFDLIFMDIHMPEMDGLEAAAKISELQAGIPIIASTANILYNDKKIYRASGMNDCLNKPFTSQELWRCLLKYLTPVRRGSGPMHHKNVPADQGGEKQEASGSHA